jgi:hypothetical protein
MNNLLVHKHLIVRAEVYRPPMDENFLTGWLNEIHRRNRNEGNDGTIREVLSYGR